MASPVWWDGINFKAWIAGVLSNIPNNSNSDKINLPFFPEVEQFEESLLIPPTPLILPIVGSFTPLLTFGGGSTGITYDTNAGRYIKTGRLVLTSGRILLTNKGSSTGTAKITGLPFPISSGSPFGSGTPVSKFLNMAAINNWFSVLAGDGTSALELWNGGTVNTTVLTEANFTNTSDINFQSAYIAAT